MRQRRRDGFIVACMITSHLRDVEYLYSLECLPAQAADLSAVIYATKVISLSRSAYWCGTRAFRMASTETARSPER
jgi:hypothetical protein